MQVSQCGYEVPGRKGILGCLAQAFLRGMMTKAVIIVPTDSPRDLRWVYVT